jgi:hypothetical protein
MEEDQEDLKVGVLIFSEDGSKDGSKACSSS